MWNDDDKILDLCTSSERSRQAWVNQLRRSSKIQSVLGLVLLLLGFFMLHLGDPRGVGTIGCVGAIMAFLRVQQLSADIRLLRLMSILRVGAQPSASETA